MAARRAHERFGVTVDILGKHDTFMLSLDGKALTPPFAGYSKQDWRDWENAESPTLTMTIEIPDARAVAASSVKSAYLAMFSLLGLPGGYTYVRGDALTPIRQRIMEPLKTGAVGEYVIKATYVEIVDRDVSFKDIQLVSKPLPCWMLKIADHLVVLPLTGASRISQPLRELLSLGGGQPITISSLASWSFSTFGAFYTVPVNLVGADTPKSLIGLSIRGTLPNGGPLEGTCIDHAGESATLLCPGPAI